MAGGGLKDLSQCPKGSDEEKSSEWPSSVASSSQVCDDHIFTSKSVPVKIVPSVSHIAMRHILSGDCFDSAEECKSDQGGEGVQPAPFVASSSAHRPYIYIYTYTTTCTYIYIYIYIYM